MLWLRRLALVLSAAAVTLLGLELLLRHLLFGAGPLAEALGPRVRKEQLFAGPRQDAYWRLRVVLAGQRAVRNELADPELGWISRRILPGSLEHVQEDELGGRRPILLYGDSFAYCKVPEELCWSGLVEASPLGKDHVLVNYGVEGYGLDQIVMLMLDTIDDWLEHDPIVVLSLLVDDDLDRSMLRFRGWAKPFFSVGQQGELVRHSVPEEELDPQVAARPIGMRSYLYNLLLQSGRLPVGLVQDLRGTREDIERTMALNRRILNLAEAELQARELDHFFLLFHGSRMLGQREDWREDLCHAALGSIEAPYVSSRSSFTVDRWRFGRTSEDYILPEGPGVGHYNPLGNEVAFGALLRGIEGMYDGPALPVNFGDTRQSSAPEELRAELFRTGPGPYLETPADHWRLVLPDEPDERPLGVLYAVRAPSSRFTGEVRLLPDTPGPALLVVRQDDEIILRQSVRAKDGRIPIDLELNDPETIAFAVHGRGPAPTGVVISSPWVHHR